MGASLSKILFIHPAQEDKDSPAHTGNRKEYTELYMEDAIKLVGITKTFGKKVVANRNVSLEIRYGEILSLLGENGSGKTTLMNILSGIYYPDEGQIFVGGEEVSIRSPKDAFALGIGMIHQHFKLVDVFTAAENIILGLHDENNRVKLDMKAVSKKVKEICDRYGFDITPDQKVYDMTVSQKQTLEIVKVLYRGADILILDEPTAVLTPQETEELFAVIRKVVREHGMTVIIITHKLYEVMAISDRVGVMRKGRLIGVENTCNVTERGLASMMVGRPVLYDKLEKTGAAGKEMIRVENLTVCDNRGLPAVKDMSLSVRAGEVLGIAAIEGNGQSELLEAITGMRPAEGGRVYVCMQDVTGKSPGEIRAVGLAHIPEDRLSTGVSCTASVADNLIMGREREKRFSGFAMHRKTANIRAYAQELYDGFDIRGAGIDGAAGSMSGGNMQKVVVAREFSFDAPVLVIAQPTRGVDVGAIEFIHSRIIEKRNEGRAILLCSADLDEVFRLSDRIITIYEGRITGEFAAGEISKEEIGYYMTGDRQEAAK